MNCNNLLKLETITLSIVLYIKKTSLYLRECDEGIFAKCLLRVRRIKIERYYFCTDGSKS